MMNAKKAGILLLTIFMLATSFPASAHAEEAWATFDSDPAAGSLLKQGDMIAYTLIMQSQSDGVQTLRIKIPKGVVLNENAFVYRPADGGGGSHSIVWGSDECVLTLPRLAIGDMLMFVAQVGNAECQTLSCSVTWNECALSLSHEFELPVQDMPEPTAEPDLAPESASNSSTAQSAVEETVSVLDEQQASIFDRQTAALLICSVLFIASSAGLIIAIRKYRKP